MEAGGFSRRLVISVLGLAVIATIGWQGRRMIGSHATDTRPLAITASAGTVAPPGDSARTSDEHRNNGRIRAEGRLEAYPGAEVTVGSEIAGRIVRLTLREKDVVRAGTVIAELDASELNA